jgi:hypothetical protein
MNDRDTEAIQRLQRKYAASANQTPKGIHLRFPGVPDSFGLSTAHGEFTLFTSAWHEHFPDLDKLESFLDGLFSGRVEIVVTYRGKTPVAQQIRVREDGGFKVVSWTRSLVPLFWRPKSCKTLTYTTANNSVERPGDPR